MNDKHQGSSYCVFCEATVALREFKAVYICHECIESAKTLEINNQEDE